MRITREPVTAYAHCPMQVDEFGELSFDVDGTPNGVDRCPGYKQVPVAAIREVSEWTFGDYNGSSTDPTDQALAQNVSHSHERVTWADLEDRVCPHCGSDRHISDQVRPVYAPLGGPRGNADQVFADRRERREQGRALTKNADAAERQAAALEEANRLKQRELDIREAELLVQTQRRKPAAKVEA